jgi:tRNA A-37 threonylcarbamoyl transferase component Bud32
VSSPALTRAPWIAEALDGAAPTEVPVVALHPGDAVPGTRYVIERWLGDGGMGVVYEARHVDIDRRVALKVLRHEFCRKPAVIRHFREEARVVSRIGSEHIVEVHDFAELPDGRLLFVMELLSGGDVGRELQNGPMEPPRVVAIMRQVCKALAAAHGARVVHRDLKPDNIALHVAHGRRDFVKVLDFGIAAVMSEAGVATHVAAGTPSYLAPEVIVGERIDHRVDVYAAGCSMYEMLTGHPPFRRDSVEAVLSAHVEDTPIAPDVGRETIHPSLSAVVMKCLAKSPLDRYPSMVELEAALCEAQIAAAWQTSWDDLPLPEIDPERRNALLRRMPDAGVKTRGSSRRLWIALAILAVVVLGLAWYAGRPLDEGPRRAPIDALVVSAHEAAARSYFVYPPPDAPDTPTALRVIVELESRARELGEEAKAQGKQLREEFAGTLVRLGDEYWERDGGKPFAIDYYAEALMFVSDHPHARSRAILTPGELAAMREKAETQTFTKEELIAAEPLIALADPDPERRVEKVDALQRGSQSRASTTQESLARLADAGGEKRRRKAKPESAPEPAPVTAPAAAVAASEAPFASTPAPAPAANDETPRAAVRDPAAAAALVAQGERARDAGRLGEAEQLFERALDADPRSHAALIGLSDVEFHRGDYTRAASFAKKAVRLAPRRAQYRVKLGDAYFKGFHYDDARAEYLEAQALGFEGAVGRLAKVDAKLGSP